MWKKFRHAKKYVYTVHDTVRAENKTELMVYHALNVGLLTRSLLSLKAALSCKQNTDGMVLWVL